MHPDSLSELPILSRGSTRPLNGSRHAESEAHQERDRRAAETRIVYWDSACPAFGVKVTPKGRKVFIVLYRAGGAGSQLRKYTIGPHGRVTLHQARAAALKIFAARTEGRDPAAEKQQARRRMVADRVEDLVQIFITDHVSQERSAGEISRVLRGAVIPSWATAASMRSASVRSSTW